MHAVRLATPGMGLVDDSVPRPEPGPDEVLIRVEAAGVCRSDLHYRSGFPVIAGLPRTLGHEVAGTVEAAPSGTPSVGTRVCVHYLVTCGRCHFCRRGGEQFCPSGRMVGKELDGGFADFLVVPARNAVPIPEGVTTRAAAVMMCSTATVHHALSLAGVGEGTTIALFGAGGLGQSAVQLAVHRGARVIALDPEPGKRELAESYGALAVDPGDDPAASIMEAAGGGVEVALDLIGSAAVMRSAIDVLAPTGVAVAVGLTADTVAVAPYADLVVGERRLMGSSDHLASELTELLAYAASGALDVDSLITASIPLEAVHVNDTLDAMARGSTEVRTVVERR